MPYALPVQLGGRKETTALRWDAEWTQNVFTAVEYQSQRASNLRLDLSDTLLAGAFPCAGSGHRGTGDVARGRAAERRITAEDPQLPPLAVGVGVNTGMCVVGNIGSRWRYDYSVLGDTVNLASRLEGLTKDYAVPIIIGESTARTIDDLFLVFELDCIAVRGRNETTPIFTVLGPASQRETVAGQALLSAQELLRTGLAQGDAEFCQAALDAIQEAHEGLTDYAIKMRAILAMRRVDAATRL